MGWGFEIMWLLAPSPLFPSGPYSGLMCPINSEIETLPSVPKSSCKQQSMKLQQGRREGTSCGSLTVWSSSRHPPVLPRCSAGWLLTEDFGGTASDKWHYGMLYA